MKTAKTPLLLLHGAIGSSEQLIPLAQSLESEFEIHLLDFSGHGKNSESITSFSISQFANDVIRYLEIHQLQNVSVLGYSIGGYVALFLARNFPNKVGKIITLATKFHWDEPSAAEEVKKLNPEKILEKIPAFATILNQRHQIMDWKMVLKLTGNMMLEMGKNNPLKKEDFLGIEHEVLICLGDHDEMISIEETTDVFRKIKNAKLFIIPDTKHPIEKLNITKFLGEVLLFYKNERN